MHLRLALALFIVCAMQLPASTIALNARCTLQSERFSRLMTHALHTLHTYISFRPLNPPMFIYTTVAHVSHTKLFKNKFIRSQTMYVYLELRLHQRSRPYKPYTQHTDIPGHRRLPQAQLICGRFEVSSKIVCHRCRCPRFQMSRFTIE